MNEECIIKIGSYQYFIGPNGALVLSRKRAYRFSGPDSASIYAKANQSRFEGALEVVRYRRKPYQKLKEGRADQVLLRNDVTKTAARYDEIIALRMLLLDVLEDTEYVDIERIRRASMRWGKKGDCV